MRRPQSIMVGGGRPKSGRAKGQVSFMWGWAPLAAPAPQGPYTEGIDDLGGLSGPGGPKQPFQKAPRLLEWFLGPPGPPNTISGRPKNHALKTQV